MPLILRPYQEEAVGRFVERIDHVPRGGLVVLPTGTGKCMKRGTKVMLYSGESIAVENVIVGDRLMGPDSMPRTVLGTTIGRGPMYKVTPMKGDPYIVNGDHILSLKMTGCDKKAKGRIVNISVHDYITSSKTFKHCAKGYRVGVEYQSKSVSLDPYFLGLWLGDGTSNTPAITTPDDCIRDYCIAYAQSFGLRVRINSNERKTCPTYHFVGDNKGNFSDQGKRNILTRMLEWYGVKNDKHVPNDYLRNSREVRMQVLAGVIDTDGHLSNGGYDVIFKPVRLAETVTTLARSLGFAAYMKQCTKVCTTTGKYGTYYRISISGDISTIPVRVPRRKAGPRLQKKDHLVHGIVVEPVGDDDYFGFETDGDHLFLLSDFTVTHNSLVMAEIAAWWLANRKGGVGIVSHRKELVRQNADEYDEIVGRTGACIKEQGSDHRATVDDWECVRAGGVISFTVQTLQNRRLMKVSRDAIGCLLIDECHRIKEQGQYDKVREYFGCKWVGLTATPDRTDGQKLVGPMFDEAWYGHQKGQLLNDFIEQGWLTPPKIRHIHVASLEWKWLRGRSGKDFTNEQVGKVWQDFKSIHQFVGPIIKEVGKRKTLYFCPKVQQAKAVADVINSTSHPRRIADYVASYKIDEDGNRSDYPKATRRDIIRRVGLVADELQHLANMGVFIEGTNIPIISAIGWLRFTKSRLLLTQGVGRALRTWPGVLNGMEQSSAAERRSAIAASPKPFALIFDPTKRAGTKLSLAHMIDVLQPGLSPEVRERAIGLIGHHGKNSGEYDPREVIEEAKHLESPFFKGLRAALMEISPDIQYRLHDIDPFSGNQQATWEMAPKEEAKIIGDSSEKQKRLIKMLAPSPYSEDFYQSLSRKQAGSIIDKLFKNPPVEWIMKKLRGMMIDTIPETNKAGLELLKRGRTQ